MQLNKYKAWDRTMSIVVFIISTTVYLLTMGKSASVWDCPEFIATFHKLEVGHPPGAPFYMLVYNFFSHFFPSGSAYVSLAANAMSAVLSGLTILLLYRTISHLIRRSHILSGDWLHATNVQPAHAYTALGGALVGSLLYAFTDTFWYSAVEAEVYSFSSFFTALVFYLMLKWEEHADEPGADRWLIAIAYLMGLSVGVHLLNLLCIPAMALLYYFKRTQKPNWRGGAVALLVSFALIAIIMFGIVQGVPEVAGWFDVFAVNILGLPFNTGLAVYVVLLIGILAYTYYATLRRPLRPMALKVAFLLSVVLMGIPFMGNSWWLPLLIITGLAVYLFRSDRVQVRPLNVMTLAMFVFFIGVSTYGVILVRANSDIPMNQNTPSDVFSLRYYLSRDQYGTTPRLYGPSYASLPAYNPDGTVQLKSYTTWTREPKSAPNQKDKYVARKVQEVVYRSDMNMLFPRVYNNTQPHYPGGYKLWGNITGKNITVYDRGETRTVNIPTFTENLWYFFSYQVNYMYWRYFLWNFSGRQNDLQGQGEITKGNWISGIPFIDSLFLGPQTDMPDFVTQNKGHNKYYMLPLILGLLGIITQCYGNRRSKETFWVILALFFMTGLAIVLYINQPPYQVRERDYAYAGSFYAFAIWIGFSVPAIYHMLRRNKKHLPALALLITVLCMAVPALVFAQNYDDHNRDGRRIASDFGRNYLESCEPNGIIFCNGDNDTFPLWYAQEVEGVRTDLRVCNTAYLQADWYIEQMKKDAYKSAALPISWGLKEYGGDKRGIVYIVPMLKDTVDVRTALAYAASDDPAHKKLPDIAQDIDHIPTDKLKIPYNTQELIAKGAIYPTDTAYIQKPEMFFDFTQKRYLGKQELIILNMLANNNFERPFYYCLTVGEAERIGMTKNFRLTGMAYQIMPFVTQDTPATVDAQRMYENVTKKFRWGGADKPGVYMDENTRRMCETYRSMVFAPLANALLAQKDTLKAKEVLTLANKAIRQEVVPHSISTIPLLDAYYKAGMKAEAQEISDAMLQSALRSLRWYFRLEPSFFFSVLREVEEQLMVTHELLERDKVNGGALHKKYGKECEMYEKKYLSLHTPPAR